MNFLDTIFIDKFYKANDQKLLRVDGLRPAKSITRDIFDNVEKFKSYYLDVKKSINLTAEEIEIHILDSSQPSTKSITNSTGKSADVISTNIRLMTELDFIKKLDNGDYELTVEFLDFIKSSVSIGEYFLKKLENIFAISDFKMTYNTVICALREGYINGKILGFPDSEKKFIVAVPCKEKRIKYRKMVEDLYGFRGRNKNPELDDYTPNANYRTITILNNLDLIKIIKNPNSKLKEYILTPKAKSLLKKINNNFRSFSMNMLNLPYNRIIFGAPGTGKSYKLDQEKNKFGSNYERVTFHPSYSYSQFVGTYKPVAKEKKDGTEYISYDFVEGPFIRVLKKAIASLKSNNPENFLLIIEEINRANVTAVFGDIFQLLDRDFDGSSKYEIATSEDLKKHLIEKCNFSDLEASTIKIPPNMYIGATMNSADQGVFPMDTAFKRRWEFEYIGINENSSGIQNIMVKLGSGNNEHEVNWNELRMAINEKLSTDCKVNEDKLIGPYFLSKDVIKVDETTNFVEDNDKFINAFKNKVIMYLYEDAAKQHKQKIFEGCDDFSRYSSVCEKFNEIGEEIFGLNLSTGSTEE